MLRQEWILLGAILLVAFALRAWGGWFGLPHVYHLDEGFEVYRAVRLGMGGFDFERIAKGGYYLLLFAEYGVYFLVLLVTGGISGVGEFAQRFVEDPSTFWKIGRTTTALLGTATVLIVWLHGRRLGGTRAGLLAAWFLAVASRHVFESHYISVDVPMTLFTLWALAMIVEDSTGVRRLRTWPFALVAAYAAMNKQPAVLLFIPYFVASCLRGGLRGPGGLRSRATWWPVLLTAGIYCVANPGLFTRFTEVISANILAITGTADPAGEYTGEVASTNLWAFYTGVLLSSQGPGLLALSLLGAAMGLWRRDRAVILHLSFLVPFLALIAGSQTPHLFYGRYTTPLIPGLCLLAGLALDRVAGQVRGSVRTGTRVALATALLVTIEPAIAVVRFDVRLTRTDTRTMAAEWIEANIPHRTAILLEGFPEDTAQLSLPLRNLQQNVREMINRLAETDPGKSKFWQLKLDTLQKPRYDLVTVRHYERFDSLADYIARGVEYVVIRREFFVTGGRGERLPSAAAASRYALYEQLLSSTEVELVASFEADPKGHPGNDIEIWRIAPPVERAPSEDDE